MATYRFTLSSLNSSLTFGADKVRNWKDLKPSFTEKKTYRGIFRDYTNTFEFTDNVRRSIIKDFDEYGYDCELYLTIEVGNDNGEFSSFRQESYRLKAEIQDIEIDDLAVSLNFVDSGFVSKVMGRDDMEINLEVSETGILESVDGVAFGTVDRLLWKTWLHDRKLIENSLYEEKGTSETINQLNSDMGDFGTIPVPVQAKYKSGDANSIIPFTYTDERNADDADLYALLPQIDFNGSVNIKGHLKGSFDFPVESNSDGSFQWWLSIVQTKKGSTTSSPDLNTVLDLKTSNDTGEGPISIGTAYPRNTRIEFDSEFDADVVLEKGDSLSIVLTISKLENPTTFICYSNIESAEIKVKYLSQFDQTICDTIPPHELFTQLLQIITGQQIPFYSEFFGRPDLGYDEYGEGSGVCVATGKMIRGFPYGVSFIDKEEVSTFLNTSFKDAFNAYNKIFNLAATIEIIGNKRRLRIEPINYFRNFEVVAKLGNNISEISRTVNTKKIYSNIQVGYTNKEYEELNGLFSFNGESGFATPLEIEAEELNLVNKWRADGIGIELARRQQYQDNPSKDYRSDNDIFLIDCNFLNGFANGTFFRALLTIRAQEYETVTGIFEPASAYNLRLSPKKCLLNWGTEIKAGLSFKTDKSLKFIKGPSNAGLSTKKTGEAEVKENTDILISDLKNAKFIPEIITIAEAPLSESDWQNIKDNRYGVIEFEHKGVTLYGFIQLAEFDINRKTANFELERANL